MRRTTFIVTGALFASAVIGSSAEAQPVPAETGEAPEEAGAEAVATEPSAEQVSALEARIESLEARLERSEEAQSEEAQSEEAQSEEAAAPAAQTAVEAAEEEPAPFTIAGWAEAYWAWSFNEPSNGIIDLRGFDNRHNSFNLANVVLDANWDYEGVNGRITLQWGSTPATYYLAETAAPSLGTGVGAQSISLWQFVQQAFVGYRIPVGEGLNVQAGLFLSPIGAEGISVKDNWLFSRSNLFYGYPFYHTGIRASYPITDQLSAMIMVMNGWNTVLDNNDEKTIHAQVSYTIEGRLTANLQYMSGVERPRGAPEGRAWRHLFDLNGTITPIDWLALQGQVTGGFEPNDFGTSSYLAGSLAVRVAPIEWLAFAVRGDMFWEDLASNASGTAAAIFWPVEWVSSTTIGAELRPADHVLFRLEYRHDQAADWACDGSPTQACAYFSGTVMGDGTTMPFLRNASTQNTITVGATAWF